MTKVLVMLSTFNGERYLKEQIVSILNQRNVDVNIFIRDDGSNDRTQEILNQLSRDNPQKIKWVQGSKNLKPARSYLEIMKLVKNEKADYYAFADQDDVWHLDKLEKASEGLHTFTNKPAIFMSTYNVVDKNLNFIFKRDMHYYWDFTLESTIVYRVPSGCTMVFNRNLFKLLVEGQPEFVRMHDYWTLLVAELVNAEIITTDEALLEYRQHGDNSVGFNKREFFKRIKRLIRSMISNKNERQRQGISLLKSYTKYIDGEQKDSLNKLVKYNSNFKSRIDLAFDRKYRTPVRQKNMLFKVAVLMGVF